MKPSTLLRLYPRKWRERYGEEVIALIEQSGDRGSRLTIDLLRGCIGAWLLTPLGDEQPSQRVIAVLGLATHAGLLILIAFLTLWLRPTHSGWRAWLLLFGFLGVMARAFVLSHRQQTDALTAPVSFFEFAVLIALSVAAGAVMHPPPPAGGVSGLGGWFEFAIIDGFRNGPAVVLTWILASGMRRIWPRAFLPRQSGPRSSILGLSE